MAHVSIGDIDSAERIIRDAIATGSMTALPQALERLRWARCGIEGRSIDSEPPVDVAALWPAVHAHRDRLVTAEYRLAEALRELAQWREAAERAAALAIQNAGRTWDAPHRLAVEAAA